MKICKIEGCEKKHYCKSYCRNHYDKYLKYGDPLIQKRRQKHKCSVENCLNLSKGLGFCKKHYERFKKRGNPLFEYVKPIASVNKLFFKSPNELNCYYAGFSAADCWIHKQNFALELQNRDFEWLKEFSKNLEYKGNINQRNKKNKQTNKVYTSCILKINCKEIVSDLKTNFNIIEKKSLILQPPNLSDENLIKSFILGYIDGDGTFGKYKNHWSLSIVGTFEILTWINNFFNKWVPPKFSGSHPTKLYKNTYIIQFGWNRAFSILSMLYLLNVPKLHRKWNIFQQSQNNHNSCCNNAPLNGFKFGNEGNEILGKL